MAGLSNLVGITDSINEFNGKFHIIPINEDGSLLESDRIELQYFPSDISDSKEVSYSAETPYGSSHPIYSYISSGERSIDFDVVFSRDVDSDDIKDKHNWDIEETIKKLRRLEYPRYDTNSPDRILVPPPKLKLLMEFNNDSAMYISGNYILTKFNFEINKFFHSGRIRYATGSLSFSEVIQLGGKINYVSYDDFELFRSK